MAAANPGDILFQRDYLRMNLDVSHCGIVAVLINYLPQNKNK